ARFLLIGSKPAAQERFKAKYPEIISTDYTRENIRRFSGCREVYATTRRTCRDEAERALVIHNKPGGNSVLGIYRITFLPPHDHGDSIGTRIRQRPQENRIHGA